MTFTWLNKQGVRSDEGFELQFTARFEAEYRERGVTTKFFVEGDGRAISIYEGALERLWMTTADSSARRLERERILSNIRAALAFQGLDLYLMAGHEPDFRS